jgi:hypothetical protein
MHITLDPVDAAAALFSELSPQHGEAWTRKMPGQATGAFTENLTSTSHYDVPITYVKCTKDKVIAPVHAQKMINDARNVSRGSADVVELAYGHCPTVVAVQETARIILSVVAVT